MDDLKSIRIELDYADENGNRSTKEQTVKVNKPTFKDKAVGFSGSRDYIYKLSFTIQIPSHIHSELVGKSIPALRGHDLKDYSKDFPKSLTRYDIENLTEQWAIIIRDYVWLKRMQSADLNKVIFYNFKNKNGEYFSEWNRINFGVKSNLNYAFAIGYISRMDGTESRYNSQKLHISSRDSDFYKLQYVGWTEERESFFTGIQKSFEAITEKLDSLHGSISEHTLDALLSNSPLQLK